jgi:hypothetical protein
MTAVLNGEKEETAINSIDKTKRAVRLWVTQTVNNEF